jgi:hypothetical protein
MPVPAQPRAFASGGSESIPSHTGCHLPVAGDIRGLIVFIRTLDEQPDDASWHVDSLPDWAYKFADSLKYYFKEISRGRLNVQLDIWPSLMKTAMIEDAYTWSGQNFGTTNKEIIKRIDEQLDFGYYDIWNSQNNSYALRQGSEGQVDLIIAIYRKTNNRLFMPYNGVSDLGFGGYLFVDSMKSYVYGGSGESNDAGASGLTLEQVTGSGMVTRLDYAFKVTIHEMMHKIYGEPHPAAVFGGLGVMSPNSAGLGLNSFEEHTLGYIKFRDINPGVDTVITMHDYLSTGEAYLLPVPQADRWFYSFEFRNRSTPFDTAPADGVYIYRIYNSWSRGGKEVRIIHADGNYKWGVDTVTDTPYKLYPDPFSGANAYNVLTIKGKQYTLDGYYGDSTSVFTPWRPTFDVLHNPTPDFIWGADTVRTGLFVKVIGMTDSTATVSISYSPPAILSTDTPGRPSPAMHRNYPNPVSRSRHSETTVEFDDLPPDCTLFQLFDALGREVDIRPYGHFREGKFFFIVPVRNLVPGVYRYTAMSSSAAKTGTIVVVE